MVQAFDLKGLRLTGNAVQVVEAVAGAGEHSACFSAVPHALAYISGAGNATALTWFDRKGNRLGTVGEPGEYYSPALSPDEKTLAVGRRDPATQTRDIWLIDLVRGTQVRLNSDPADDLNPTWSPDGSRIAFTSTRKGQRDIYEKAASGMGEERLLLSSGLDKNVEWWSPDGRSLLYNHRPSAAGLLEIWQLPLQNGQKPSLVLSGPADTQSAQLSPDGKFVAYHSNETGRYEIFIQDFPPSGKRWPVSPAGGMFPQWRADGKELFYCSSYSKLMVVDINIEGSRLEVGVPHALFEAPFWTSGRNLFVPSHNGQRFLAVLRPEQTANPSITVELNWMSGSKR